LWRGHLIEAAAQAPGPRLTLPASCDPASKPPHIILIHEESVVPPSYFPSLSYDGGLDPFFHSHDGKLHKLRVETYGGASWLTEFSVLTGLPAFSLGNLRQFVQTIMAGKVRDTLPQALARCGYRNVAFHPMLRIYLSIGKFLEAVGVHQTFDAKDQGAKLANERDRFYYANALAEMERHFKTSNQPLFTFIETMATHGPYDYTYMPETDVPGGGPGTHPGIHEYLRRLAMARMDYAFLRSELSRRFPDQQFLLVHYGDHHPSITRILLGFGEEADFEQVMRSANDAALITYYAVDAVHYRPPPLPDLETVDVAYLGTIILAAARIPLSDVYRERKRLMMLCTGRYHGCSERNEILRFHRRLINSGIVDAR
jgi:phosphoglycerol transferase MdoB-like AlkP superfamily enzyme